MDQGPLVNDQIEAGKAFIERFEECAPVRAAFWLKRGDDDSGYWYFHVASDEIDDTNFHVAYGDVARVAKAMPEPKLDPLRVKLVVRDERLVRAVEDLQRRSRSTRVTHYHDVLLGGVHADEVFVYPPRVTAAP